MDVVERLCTVADRYPDHPAVAEVERVTSYAGFLGRVGGMAAALTRIGEHPRVAILLPQGGDAYAAMFATLVAGGYYLPCNIASPPAKLAAILVQFRPQVIIARDTTGLCLPEGCVVLKPDQPPRHKLPVRPPHKLAYVIFTSGSTGQPKGVMIPRTALNHYTDWAIAAMAPDVEDRWSQHPNIGFDLSVLDVYGALCSGASLHPLQSEMDRMLPARFIAKRQLTIWNSVPSVVDMMVRAGDTTAERLGSVRLFTFCGEPLYVAQATALLKANPGALVHNTYGPTEATVSCTLVRLDAVGIDQTGSDTVTIGEAIPGMALHCIACEAGSELAISGPQLADGYWDDPARTEAAFRSIVIDGHPVRAYFTGDLVRRGDGGALYFERRRDTQVKVRGHRLELDEINAAIRGLGHVVSATILRDGRLHAFVVTQGELDAEGLRRQLAAMLDPHAVPSYIHPLPDLPRNANDKVDLAALGHLAEEWEKA